MILEIYVINPSIYWGFLNLRIHVPVSFSKYRICATAFRYAVLI